MKAEQDSPKNILLVALTRLGDMLQASPTIAGLKQQYPNAKLTVLIEKNFASVCEGIPGIDEQVVIDLGYVYRSLIQEGQGIVDAYAYFNDWIKDLRDRQFDYCLNMSASGFTATLLNLLDIKDSRGWRADDEGTRIISTPWARILGAFLFHNNREYNAINIVDLFRCSAGVVQHPRHLVYRVPDESRAFARRFLSENFDARADGPVICIQAGASQIKRQWHPAKFIDLIKHLVADLNARIVLTGTKGELPIIEHILSGCEGLPVANAAGKTSLNELAGLLERADLLITGDTGPMHLSVAVGTRVVALFLASAFAFETGPYGEGNIVVHPTISCTPCNPNLSCARPDCHEQITPALIAYLAKLRLETQSAQIESIQSSSVLDPNQVTVFISEFDQDGFVDFRPISPLVGRKGLSAETPFVLRNAYKELWKDEFDAVLPENVSVLGQCERSYDEVKSVEHDGLIRFAERGISLVERLKVLIRDIKSPPKLLGETSSALTNLDREIEEFGLGYSGLGPLIRMFVLEKENMRGNDPLQLASEMEFLYETVIARTKKFAILCDHFSRQFTGEYIVQGASAKRSFTEMSALGFEQTTNSQR